ncbi:MAG: hypothetical protein FWD15_00845 [Alphaproteobacteria bacterium]|nr:hypothetical protein [Alphaproteobacteria bacterium]
MNEMFLNIRMTLWDQMGNRAKAELLSDLFFHKTGRRPTEELARFNDKIRWAMMFDPTLLKCKCTDKLAVREYVADKIGEQYLPAIYGAYDKPEDIDWDALPERFILQHNASSGRNIVVGGGKSRLDKGEAARVMSGWLGHVYGRADGEMHYSLIPQKIIARELLDIRTDIEVMMMCFNGRVEFIRTASWQHSFGAKQSMGERYYSRDWGDAGFQQISSPLAPVAPKPKKLDLMIELAEKLAAGINHVRVDFYELANDDIMFSEMTFSNHAGWERYNTEEAELRLGSLFQLPQRDADGFSRDGRHALGL